ncbi:MAG: mechanosensitive ion channel family protein [Polyangiales bacterium]
MDSHPAVESFCRRLYMLHGELSEGLRMEAAADWMQEQYLGNPPWRWLLGLCTIIFVAALSFIIRRVVRTYSLKLVKNTRTELMEVPLEIAAKTSNVALWAVALFCGLSLLHLPDKLRGPLEAVVSLVAFWQLGLWGSAGVLAWLVAKRRLTTDSDRAAASSLGIIGFVLRVLIWTLVLLLTLDNLGVDITALVAGLGVGGIAVALAVQNVLGDLFASLSISLDRPFVLGDFIIVGDYMGSVEHIGVKSTRLRSLGGEQIVMCNTDLLKSRLRNYGRMMERRVVFSVRVTYETPRDKLRQIPRMIRECVEGQPSTRFDRSHFASYGQYALEFESVYYVLSADYNHYMDIQQAVFFGIHERFEAAGIVFAYPTQQLWVKSAERVLAANTNHGEEHLPLSAAR